MRESPAEPVRALALEASGSDSISHVLYVLVKFISIPAADADTVANVDPARPRCIFNASLVFIIIHIHVGEKQSSSKQPISTMWPVIVSRPLQILRETKSLDQWEAVAPCKSP